MLNTGQELEETFVKSVIFFGGGGEGERREHKKAN